MKKLLFGKDDAAPDAKTVREWMDEQGIERLYEEIQIQSQYADVSTIFKTADGRLMMIETSCGIDEDLYEVDFQEIQSTVMTGLNGFYSEK